MSDKLYIGISGIIAAGKTTLARSLGEVMDLKVYYENVKSNVYLEDFYKDQKKYGFPLQIHLLTNRFKQQQQIIWSGRGAVQDRTIYEDKVFCRMLLNSGMMEQRDYDTYEALFNVMSKFMQRPHLIVHLDVSPKEAFRRLRLRDRNCEAAVSIEYLENLYNEYEIFIKEISKQIPVIRVDYEKFRTAEKMAEMINKEWIKMGTVKKVSIE